MPPFQLPFQTPDGRTPLQQLRDEYSVPLNERGGIDYDKLRGTFAGPEEAPQQIQQQPQKDPRETAAIRKQIALRAAQRIVKDGNYSAAPRIIRKDGTNEVLPDIQTPAGWFRKESVTSKGEHSGGFGDWLWNRGGEVGGYEITKSRELNDIVSDEDINVMLQDISNRNYAQFGEENTIDPNEFKSLLKTQSLAKAMFTEMVENKLDWGSTDENNFKKIFRSLPPNEQAMFSNALDTMTEDGGINEGPIWRFVDSLAKGVSGIADIGTGVANLIGSKSDEQIEGEQIEAGAKALVDEKLEEAGMVGNVFNTAAEILPPMLAGGYVGKGASAVAAAAGAGAKVAGGVGSAAGMGYWFDMTAGDVKDRLRAAGLDDTQATLFAIPSAAAIASMELLQVGRYIKGFKGNNAGLLAQVTKNSSGFKEKLLQNTITKAGSEFMKTGLKEGGQEALQQAVEEGTMFLASKMHDSEFDLGESFDNVRHAFTDSVFAMALIGAPGAVSKSLSEKRGIESLRARMAIMDSTVSEKIDELVDLNHGSQDPQNFNELLDWATNPERADEAFPEILRQATEGEGGVLNAPIESVIEFMGDRLKSGVVESINRNRERLLEGRDEAWEYLDTSIEEALGNAKEREGHQGVADILIGHLENNPAIADKFGDLISSGNLSRGAFKKLILASGDAFKKDGSVNTETASGKLMLELMDHIEKTGGDAKVKRAAPGTFVVASTGQERNLTAVELMGLEAADFNAWVGEVSGQPGQYIPEARAGHLEGSMPPVIVEGAIHDEGIGPNMSAAQERARLINEFIPDQKFVLPTNLLRLGNQNKRQRKIFNDVMQNNIYQWIRQRQGGEAQVDGRDKLGVDVAADPRAVATLDSARDFGGESQNQGQLGASVLGPEYDATRQPIPNRGLAQVPDSVLQPAPAEILPTAPAGTQPMVSAEEQVPATVETQQQAATTSSTQQQDAAVDDMLAEFDQPEAEQAPLDDAGVERVANTIGDMFSDQGVEENQERIFETIETAKTGEGEAKITAQRDLLNIMSQLADGKIVAYEEHTWEPIPEEELEVKKLGDSFERLVGMGYLDNLSDYSSRDVRKRGLDPEAALQAAVEINRRRSIGEEVSREDMDNIIFEKHTGQERQVQRTSEPAVDAKKKGLKVDPSTQQVSPRSQMTPGEFVFSEPGSRGIAQIGKADEEEKRVEDVAKRGDRFPEIYRPEEAAPEPMRGDPVAQAEQAAPQEGRQPLFKSSSPSFDIELQQKAVDAFGDEAGAYINALKDLTDDQDIAQAITSLVAKNIGDSVDETIQNVLSNMEDLGTRTKEVDGRKVIDDTPITIKEASEPITPQTGPVVSEAEGVSWWGSLTENERWEHLREGEALIAIQLKQAGMLGDATFNSRYYGSYQDAKFAGGVIGRFVPSDSSGTMSEVAAIEIYFTPGVGKDFGAFFADVIMKDDLSKEGYRIVSAASLLPSDWAKATAAGSLTSHSNRVKDHRAIIEDLIKEKMDFVISDRVKSFYSGPDGLFEEDIDNDSVPETLEYLLAQSEKYEKEFNDSMEDIIREVMFNIDSVEYDSKTGLVNLKKLAPFLERPTERIAEKFSDVDNIKDVFAAYIVKELPSAIQAEVIQTESRRAEGVEREAAMRLRNSFKGDERAPQSIRAAQVFANTYVANGVWDERVSDWYSNATDIEKLQFHKALAHLGYADRSVLRRRSKVDDWVDIRNELTRSVGKNFMMDNTAPTLTQEQIESIVELEAPAGPQEGPSTQASMAGWNLPDTEVNTSDVVPNLSVTGETIIFTDREGNERTFEDFATPVADRVYLKKDKKKEKDISQKKTRQNPWSTGGWKNLPAADGDIDIDHILTIAPGLEYIGIQHKEGPDVHGFKAAHGEVLLVRAVKFIPGGGKSPGYSEDHNRRSAATFEATRVSGIQGMQMHLPGKKRSHVIIISELGLASPVNKDSGPELEEIIHWAQTTGRWSPEINDMLQKEFSKQALVSGVTRSDQIEDTAKGLAIAITDALKRGDPASVGPVRDIMKKVLEWFNDFLIGSGMKAMDVDYIVKKWLSGEIVGNPEFMVNATNVMRRQVEWKGRKELTNEEREEIGEAAEGIDGMHEDVGPNTRSDAAQSFSDTMANRIGRLARIKRDVVKNTYKTLEPGRAQGAWTSIKSWLRKEFRVVPLEGAEARKELLKLAEEREGFAGLYSRQAQKFLKAIEKSKKDMGIESFSDKVKELMYIATKNSTERKELLDVLTSEISDKEQLNAAVKGVGEIQKLLGNLRDTMDELSRIVINDETQRSEQMAVILDKNLEVYVNRKYRLFEDPKGRKLFLTNTPEGKKLIEQAAKAARAIDYKKKYNKIKDNLFAKWRKGERPVGMKVANVIAKENEFKEEIEAGLHSASVDSDSTTEQVDDFVDFMLREWFMNEMESPEYSKRIAKKARKATISEQRSQDEVYDYLDSPTSGNGGSEGLARNTDQFNVRKDLDEAFKKLYGEIRGAEAVGISITTLASNIAGHNFQKSLVESALFDNHIDTKSGGNRIHKLIGREYGQLNGKYVTNEFKNAVERVTGQTGLLSGESSDSLISNLLYAVAGLSHASKGMKTIMNPKTATRNSIEEHVHAFMNGWWNPITNVFGGKENEKRALFRQALAIAENHADVDANPILKYIANPGLGNVRAIFGKTRKMDMSEHYDAEASSLHQEVSELGLLNNSLQKVWDEQRENLEVANPLDILTSPDTSDMKIDTHDRAEGVSSMFRRTVGKLTNNKLVKEASKLYQVPSDAVRVMGYVAEKANINKAIAWEVEQDLKGENMSKAEVAEAVKEMQEKRKKATNREAADKVKDLVPTASRVPRLVKDMSLIPVVGNFPVWFTGYVKSMTNQWKIGLAESMSKNEATSRVGLNRLMRATLTQAVLAGFARGMYMLFGFDDDDMEAIENSVPKYQRNHTLIPIPNPFGEGFSVFDVSQSFPSVMFMDWAATAGKSLKKDGISGVIGAGISEATSMFTDEDIFMSSVWDIFIRDGENKFGYKVWDSLDSTLIKGVKAIDHVTLGMGEGFRGPLSPGMIPELNRIVESVTGKETPSGIVRSPTGVFFRNMIGSEATGFVPKTMLTMKAKEFQEARRKYTRSLNKAGYSGNSSRFKSAIQEFEKNNSRLYNEMGSVIHAARLGGMEDGDIYQRLLKFNVPKTDIQHWMTDRVRGSNMSTKTLQGIFQEGGQEMVDVYVDSKKRGNKGE